VEDRQEKRMKSIRIVNGMLALALALCVTAQAAVDQATVDRAFARLAEYQYGDDYMELAPIERAVSQSLGNESARAALEKRLIDVLRGTAPNGAKDYACRMLSLIGTAQSVPALAALLPDPDLTGLARFALERIPDPAVDRAFLEAVEKTSGRYQAGVINSIGIRRDPAAVKTLANRLKADDPVVVEAALLALGKIATTESARILAQFRSDDTTRLRQTAAAAYLEAADRLLQAGNAEAAGRIYEQLYRDHESGALHLAGFQGLVAARPSEANQRLLTALSAEDVPVRNLAARLVSELPGETPRAFLDALGNLPGDAQVALLGALRLRGDGTARPVVLPLLKSEDAPVRMAAIDALSSLGTAADVLPVARIAASGPRPEREVAQSTLALLPGADINQAILAAMAEADPVVKVELLRSLIPRVARETVSTVAGHLTDSDARVGRAAAEVLSAMGDEGQVPALVRFVAQATADSQREAGVRALTSIAGRVSDRAVDGLLSGLDEAQSTGRAALLRVLPVIGGERALNFVRQGIKDRDEDVRDGSVRALINWREAEAAPDMLATIQTTENASHRVLAFRGYVRLTREIDVPPARRFEMVKEAAKLAQTPEDKRLVIGALGEIQTVEALKMAAGYLEDSDLANEAGAAVVKIAPGLDAAARPTAIEALEQVTSKASAQPIIDDARRALDRLQRGSSR
jgi:HEAT repeat protein